MVCLVLINIENYLTGQKPLVIARSSLHFKYFSIRNAVANSLDDMEEEINCAF